MKIAIIHPFQFRYGRGIERFTWSLSAALSARGVQVDLLTWRWPDEVHWGDLPPRVRVRRVPGFRYFMARACVPFYLKWLLQGQYDWVMLFFAAYGEAETLRVLSRLRQQRHCVVFHFPREQVPHRYREFERSGLARRADRLIAVSTYVARGVQEQFGRECQVIGNGVDPETFKRSPSARAQMRQKLGIAESAPVLITLAALEERKGVQHVIEAIPALLPDFPDLRYWVLGEGGYRPELEAQIRRLRLEHSVSLWGNIEDVVSYLAAADIGCLLAYGESFGIAVFEYMAMELPVLVSQHPPFPELVAPSFGVKVDERDGQQVVNAIRELLLHPEKRRTMGQAGRQTVLRQYTWDHVAEQYLQVLGDSSSGSGPRLMP
ncbi:MAG: glycosyltransferase family 4 protein [Chloroflexi bacterium]|nr:glycosyltransferase family 4 protein [Chloroflexota bacterium]